MTFFSQIGPKDRTTPEQGTEADPALAALLRLVADVFEVPVVFVALGGGADRTIVAGQGGFEPDADAHAFSRDVIAARDMIVVPDTRSQLRATDAARRRESAGRFQAGTPLWTDDGACLGALCLFDTEPRAALKSRSKRRLLQFGRAIAAQIEDARAARDRLQKAEAEGRLAAMRLRDTIDAVDQGIALFDAEDLPVLCNRRYARWCNGESEIDGPDPTRHVREVRMHDGTRIAWEDRPTTEGGSIAVCTKLGAFEDDRRPSPNASACGDRDRRGTGFDGDLQETAPGARTGHDSVPDSNATATALLKVDDFDQIKILFYQNPQPMYITDPATGRFLDVNEKAIEFYGYDRAKFLEMNLFDIVLSSEHESMRQIIMSREDSVASAKSWVHIKADGSLVHVMIHRKTQIEGIRARRFSVITDITDQKKAECELVHTRAFFEKILNLVPNPIFVKDVRKDYRYMVANQATVESGKSQGRFLHQAIKSDFIGLNDYELFDSEIASAFRRQDETAANNGGKLFVDYHTSTDKNGNDRTMWVKILPVSETDDDKASYIVGIIEDITDLRKREDSFRLLFEANPISMLTVDLEDHRITAANNAAVKFYKYSREHFLSLKIFELQASPQTASAPFDWQKVPQGCVWQHRRGNGREAALSVHWTYSRHNDRDSVLLVVIDVTERELAEMELRRTRTFLDRVVESIPAAVFAKDMQDEGRYVLTNKAHADLIGQTFEAIIGRTDEEIFQSADAASFKTQDQGVIDSGVLKIFEAESFTLPNGEVRLVTTKKIPVIETPGKKPRLVVGITEDITERRRMHLKIEHMAHHDTLTDLPNRLLFHERLEIALADAAGHPDRFAVLAFDLDQFKAVNDTLGHPTGDSLLRAVAERLRGLLQPTDTPARLGGDEFAVLQTPVADQNACVVLASRLLKLLSEPYEINGQHLVIGVTVGIAIGVLHGDSPDDLLQNADIALYWAKSERRGTFRIFEAEMTRDLKRRRALEQDLRQALVRGEFEVHYQPLVDVATHRITGCEALVRWRHPERGLVSPAEFIPVAEEIGLIGALGDWVLRQACAEAATWPPHVKIAVNLSSVQFTHRDLTASIVSALAAANLPAARLELEITESVLLAENETNISTLHQLQALGVGISLDDFGTGYSALGYLRTFPFNKIKIDRSFVKDLGVSNTCLPIIRAVIGLGVNLGMRTIAEGVETEAQLAQVTAEGCDEVQGYFFSKPRPAAEIVQLLRQDHAFGRAA